MQEKLIKSIENAKRKRGFELVKGQTDTSLLPERSTAQSAGYDFKAAETVTIKAGEIVLVPTGVKAYMQDDEVLKIYDRSSNPIKHAFATANSVGIIDADYYSNPENDGQIYGQFMNLHYMPITIEKGQRLMQGIFEKYLVADVDNATGQRSGGFGSTGV